MKKIKVTLIGLLVIIIAIGIIIQLQRYRQVSNMEQVIENSENQANAYSSLTEYSASYTEDMVMGKYIEGTQAFYKVYTKQTGKKYKDKKYTELTPTELIELIEYSKDNMDQEIVTKVEGGLVTEDYEKIYYGFIMDLLNEEQARLKVEIAKVKERSAKQIKGYKELLDNGTITQEEYDEYTKSFDASIR